ncbi:AMP-binding protein [Chelativorans xinjiangense]|uniref:AMP-binding protein n=1 Tax=Chelativorans xinjiangense TaxID=2681485 RepID=UPI00248341C7|nr:AMP-binding protein [Chelativorans xinjiangense]
MMGYWKDDVLTNQTLDATGWLSTGDLAEIRDGRVFIRGRLSETIVLSIGEKVNPTVIEAEITYDTLFEQAAVIGDRQPHLVAIIVLNNEAWRSFAEEINTDPEYPNAPPVKTKVLARLERLLAGLPRHAQVLAVHLTLEPWTIESGLMTPTLKVKRLALQRVFSEEIEQLYSQRSI